MREYLTLHRSVFPSYLTIESGRIYCILAMYIGVRVPVCECVREEVFA